MDHRHVVIPRTLVFLLHGEDVLLLRGAPHKRLYPNQYNGLGGHVERGEDVYAAALREVYEETGLRVQALRLGAVIHVDGEPGVMLFVFLGHSPTRQVRPSEEGDLEWVPLSRLEERPVVPDLPLLLPRLLTQPEDALPLYAFSMVGPDGRPVLRFCEAPAGGREG